MVVNNFPLTMHACFKMEDITLFIFSIYPEFSCSFFPPEFYFLQDASSRICTSIENSCTGQNCIHEIYQVLLCLSKKSHVNDPEFMQNFLL